MIQILSVSYEKLSGFSSTALIIIATELCIFALTDLMKVSVIVPLRRVRITTIFCFEGKHWLIGHRKRKEDIMSNTVCKSVDRKKQMITLDSHLW